MALLLPEATTIVLVTVPPAVTVPPKAKAERVLAKPPFSETVPPLRVRSRKVLNWLSEVMLPPASIVTRAVVVAVAPPQVSVAPMPSVAPLLTTMVEPERIDPTTLVSVPPSIVTPPAKPEPPLFRVKESLPAPALTKPPAPVICPPNV